MNGYLYILISLKNGSYYIGSSRNVELRMCQHNSGNVKATKHKRPYKLAFKQEYENVDLAHRAELKIKSWKRKDFIDKIIKDNHFNYSGR